MLKRSILSVQLHKSYTNTLVLYSKIKSDIYLAYRSGSFTTYKVDHSTVKVARRNNIEYLLRAIHIRAYIGTRVQRLHGFSR